METKEYLFSFSSIIVYSFIMVKLNGSNFNCVSISILRNSSISEFLSGTCFTPKFSH